MFKKMMILTCFLFILFGMLPKESYAKNVTLKLSHHRPVDSQLDKDMKQYAIDVEKQTDGRVKIEVFPAGQLGGSEAAMERVSMGAIDMMIGYPNTELDAKLDIYCLPGIAKNFPELKKLFAKGSPYMSILEDTFNDLDMHVLASYTTAFSGMCFKNTPESPKNPNAKHNEKIRVPGINAYRYVAEAIGYMGTPLPWGEVFTALQTGVVDGVYGPGAEPTYSSLRDVINTYIPVNTQADMFFLLINEKTFGKISDVDRITMNKLGATLEKNRFAKGQEEQRMWEKRLAEYKGIKVVKLSDSEISAFQKKTQDYTWKKLKVDMGATYFDKVINAYKKAMSTK